MIADQLIDLHDICPEAGPQLAGIMQESMALDRLNAETVKRLKTDHAREATALRDEIAECATEIESLEIATSLLRDE